ncbi:MAG: PEP-CTERM sorting domain-containing protein [Cellvibrionaceae bacterium]
MMSKSFIKVAAAASLMMSASFANALVAIDGWQIDTTNAPTIAPAVTTNIGHLNLAGGSATVEQEVNLLGNPFAGARFDEFGSIFSIAYTPENVVGLGDFGLPSVFAGGMSLELVFDGLQGVVTSYDIATGAIDFLFDSGVGSVNLEATIGGVTDVVASFSVVSPSGGDLGDFGGSAGTQGQSTISSLVVNSVSDLFRDSAGNSLSPLIAANELFAQVVTTNSIFSPFAFAGPCSFDNTAFCATGVVNSEGRLDLLRIPEPLTTMLMSIGLLAMALIRRRKTEFDA